MTTSSSSNPKIFSKLAKLYMDSSFPCSKHYLGRLALCASLFLLSLIYTFSYFYLSTLNTRSSEILTAHSQLSALFIIVWMFFIPTNIPTIKKVFAYFCKTFTVILIMLFEPLYYSSSSGSAFGEFLFAFCNIFVLSHFLHMLIYIFIVIYQCLKHVLIKTFHISEERKYIPKILLTLDSIASLIVAITSIISAIIILLNGISNFIDKI